MPVGLNALPGKLSFEAEGNYGIEHGLIHWDPIVADNNAVGITFLSGRQLPPPMFPDVIHAKSLLGIGVQYLG